MIKDDGSGIGRGVTAHVVGHDHGINDPTAYLYGNLFVLDDVTVNVSHADRPQLLLVGLQGFQTLALDAPHGDHGSAGHKADMFVTLENLGPFTGDASPCHGDGLTHPGQIVDEGIISREDSLEGLILHGQPITAHEISFQGRKAYGELRQGAGKDGDFLTLGVFTQLMAIEGQVGFQPEGISRAQPNGCRPL